MRRMGLIKRMLGALCLLVLWDAALAVLWVAVRGALVVLAWLWS